jgi:hypothetical protein
MKWISKLTVSFFAIVICGSASADLRATFKKIDKSRKGPFSLNYLQGTRGRAVVNEGHPAGSFQFQAAFRNEIGRELAVTENFYVANLFTTNYYELMGEYVYGDAYGSHELDHRSLAQQGPKAIAKANSMVKHWVLEKHYVDQWQNSPLAKSFKLRGIGGSEFEQVYANYFFNFYLTAMNDELQYLPALLLIKGSPIGESASLEKARTLIASTYEYFEGVYGARDSRVTRLYELRNAIHNQLSQSVIDEIDRYVRDFPFYKEEGHTYLFTIQSILRNFFGVSPKRIGELAQKLNMPHIKALADQLTKNGPQLASLLELSMAVAEVRAAIGDSNAIPYDKKTDALLMIINTAQYLNKEVTSMKTITSPDVVKIILNTVYMEGFMLKDNWKFLVDELNTFTELGKAIDDIPDIVIFGEDTFRKAMEPALDQWITVEPKMQNFVDDTVKSSALNTASIVAQKVKR